MAAELINRRARVPPGPQLVSHVVTHVCSIAFAALLNYTVVFFLQVSESFFSLCVFDLDLWRILHLWVVTVPEDATASG